MWVFWNNISCWIYYNNVKDHSKEVAWRCSVKKMFLKVHKIHREIPMPGSLFYKISRSEHDFEASVFQWILQCNWEHFFYKTHLVAASALPFLICPCPKFAILFSSRFLLLEVITFRGINWTLFKKCFLN